jgi:hypothetical protein
MRKYHYIIALLLKLYSCPCDTRLITSVGSSVLCLAVLCCAVLYCAAAVVYKLLLPVRHEFGPLAFIHAREIIQKSVVLACAKPGCCKMGVCAVAILLELLVVKLRGCV